MKNEMVKFDFKGRSVRVIQVGDHEEWVAKDVCEALGIEKHRDAISSLDDDERGSVVVDTLGGPQEMATVKEAGLWKLILRSRKPAAKQFTRWVTHEVLPQIRKTGFWSASGENKLAAASQVDLAQFAGVVSKAVSEGVGMALAAIQQQYIKSNEILLEGIQRLVSRNLQEHVEATHITQQVIGAGGSWHIRERIKTIAEIRFPDDLKMQRIERSAMQLNLRTYVQFFGTGRSWNHMPQDKWQQSLNWLEEQYRSAIRAAKAAGKETPPEKKSAVQLAFDWKDTDPKGTN